MNNPIGNIIAVMTLRKYFSSFSNNVNIWEDVDVDNTGKVFINIDKEDYLNCEEDLNNFQQTFELCLKINIKEKQYGQ